MSDLTSMFGPRSRMNRRTMLKGSALLGGAALLNACSNGNSPGLTGGGGGSQQPIEPKIDGDLYYFNWAQYLNPKLFDGFQKHLPGFRPANRPGIRP